MLQTNDIPSRRHISSRRLTLCRPLDQHKSTPFSPSPVPLQSTPFSPFPFFFLLLTQSTALAVPLPKLSKAQDRKWLLTESRLRHSTLSSLSLLLSQFLSFFCVDVGICSSYSLTFCFHLTFSLLMSSSVSLPISVSVFTELYFLSELIFHLFCLY